MKEYSNLVELIKDHENIPVPGGLYISKASGVFKDKSFVSITSKERKNSDYIEDEKGHRTPVFLVDKNVTTWLGCDVFQDIIENRLSGKSLFSIYDIEYYVEAIEYYLENDDFIN